MSKVNSMWRLTFVTAVSVACLWLCGCGSTSPRISGDGVPKDLQKDDSRTLIVFYDVKVGKAVLLKAAREYGSEVYYDYNNFNAVALSVPEGKTSDEAVEYYNKVKGVIQVNKDRKVQLD